MSTHILKFFEYRHLPEELQEVSKQYSNLAHWTNANIIRNEEKEVALRKLLEAKDAAVRARLDAPQ